MKSINVQIQWRARHGWTYRVYEFSDSPDDITTAIPTESGELSDLVEGANSQDPNVVTTLRAQFEAAIQVRFPGANVQFGKVPVNQP